MFSFLSCANSFIKIIFVKNWLVIDVKLTISTRKYNFKYLFSCGIPTNQIAPRKVFTNRHNIRSDFKRIMIKKVRTNRWLRQTRVIFIHRNNKSMYPAIIWINSIKMLTTTTLHAKEDAILTLTGTQLYFLKILMYWNEPQQNFTVPALFPQTLHSFLHPSLPPILPTYLPSFHRPIHPSIESVPPSIHSSLTIIVWGKMHLSLQRKNTSMATRIHVLTRYRRCNIPVTIHTPGPDTKFTVKDDYL